MKHTVLQKKIMLRTMMTKTDAVLLWLELSTNRLLYCISELIKRTEQILKKTLIDGQVF